MAAVSHVDTYGAVLPNTVMPTPRGIAYAVKRMPAGKSLMAATAPTELAAPTKIPQRTGPAMAAAGVRYVAMIRNPGTAVTTTPAMTAIAMGRSGYRSMRYPPSNPNTAEISTGTRLAVYASAGESPATRIR